MWVRAVHTKGCGGGGGGGLAGQAQTSSHNALTRRDRKTVPYPAYPVRESNPGSSDDNSFAPTTEPLTYYYYYYKLSCALSERPFNIIIKSCCFER